MTARLYLVERSETLIVSLADMKKHLRRDDTDDDDLIEELIHEVTEHLDGEDGILNRALVDQTWDLKLDSFPCGDIEILLPPLIEVVSIGYYDSDDALQALDVADLHVIGANAKRQRGRIRLGSGDSWPTVYDRPEAATIRFRAGYMSSDSPQVENIPRPIKQALKLLVGSRYEHRETIVIGQTAIEIPWSADQLLLPYRIFD